MPAGKLLWEPDSASSRKTNVYSYTKWLEKRGMKFGSYDELWKWSVEDIEGFWGSIWKYYDVMDVDYVVLSERTMPGARWFDGSELNFAERVFRDRRDGTALLSKKERGSSKETSWTELEGRTGVLASKMKELGVAAGDRVAAILPNGPEAVIAFLATASLGAVWSSCSPEFGAPAIVDRFSQIRPRLLFAADGYTYGGKTYDKTDAVKSVADGVDSIERVVHVPGGAGGSAPEGALDWGDLTKGKAKLEFETVPFEHPLWVLYSSGTTGLPKPIVHSHGGILLELLKALSLHNDIRPGDRFFWYTTTGWMMWNYLVGGLLHGATIVLYAGSPSHPRGDGLWDLVEKTKTTFMGTSAAYLTSCMKEGLEPGLSHDLSSLRGIGSTGSPLPAAAFEWVYSKVKGDVWLASMSGGTDVCTAFVGGCPTLPVYSGEIQCRCLGAKVEAFGEDGAPVVGKVGELVVTEPMPSMPIYMWGDEDGSRYRESYFESFPGVWRHGDWVKITSRGTCVIYGRSDATIKRQGVRIGTSEIYSAVDGILEVSDSLAVEVVAGKQEEMILFVTLRQGAVLDDDLRSRIVSKVRRDLSPRHVPDLVVEAPSIPRTVNGKKLEVPVKRILEGGDPLRVLNKDSLADPASLEFYVRYAREHGGGGKV